MSNINLSIENIIQCIAGSIEIPGISKIKILPNDRKLINSFSKQISNGIGFTDRQLLLAQKKVNDYKEYFQDLDIDNIVNVVDLPIRTIDRSRWIRIISDDNDNKIGIRFVYSNKLINSLNSIKKEISSDYDPENKIHYFPYTEKNLYKIVKEFKDKNFELDDVVVEIFNKLDSFKKEDHIPGIYNLQLKNLSDKAINELNKELGNLDIDSLYLYKERHIKYGLHYFDDDQVNASLSSKNNFIRKLCYRSNINVVVNPDHVNVGELFLNLEDLKRLPILIVLDQQNCYDALTKFQKHLTNLVRLEDISVMFRLDNSGEGLFFNNYIKDNGLNNKLDKNTKVVYTLYTKISKPILNSDWNPKTVLFTKTYTVNNIRKATECYKNIDLMIHYDNETPNLNFYTGQKLEQI